ncbi:hypothetical protein BCR34DRAFT_605506 [Clohesyomyces aquaticus]|uniref:Uncharacterized protein n=1 Tax=Clohesyomyces aquaticus TaxID=1231657 RepID=A0A1Y1YX91_9PLEO|nr:hypothetical protein BCR34DRAFT_605506 [Clohesyomyces aquaticus]
MEHSRRLFASFWLLLVLHSASVIASPAGSHGLQNFTVSLPEGTRNHGNPRLICTPTEWTDVATFFLGNYITHALTVVILPGEEPLSYITNALRSLLFPAFGAYRGLRAISVGYMTLRKLVKRGWPRGTPFKRLFHAETWEENELQIARRSGALCMIVRSSEWEPMDGDEIQGVLALDAGKIPVKKKNKTTTTTTTSNGKDGVVVQEEEITARGPNMDHVPDTQGLLAHSAIEMNTLNPTSDSAETKVPWVRILTYPAPWTYCREEGADSIGSRTVRCSPEDTLADGYKIIMLPPSTPVRDLPRDPNDMATDRIGANYSIMKVIVSLVQAAFAVQTLYQSRGDQTKRYGYSAFGLTVAPYAIMSFINLLGALSRPEYDAIYLVGSQTMIEERKRKGLDGYYEGTVGELLPPDPDMDIDFTTTKTTDGMTFIPGSIKFSNSPKGLLHASYTPPPSPSSTQNATVSVLVCARDPDLKAILPITGRTYLLIPSTPPFSYHMKSPEKPRVYDGALPFPKYNYTAQGFSFPLARATMTHLLPRCVRYLERSRSFSFFVSMTPLIPIGVLSHFKTGDLSRVSERVITMLWFSWGAVMGWLIAEMGEKDTVGKKIKGKLSVSSAGWRMVGYLVLGSPAILGWWVVGRMLVDYGTCTVLPGG